MAISEDQDPVLQAFGLWNQHGWAESAHGLAAVTSVLRVNQMLVRRADQLLAAMDLNFARYQVLVMLYFGGGTSAMAQLGKHLDLHQTTITHLVDKLQARELVRRRPHPTDRRSTIAEMTPRGRSATQKAITLLNGELFGELNLTTDENRLLIGLLARMRGAWGEFEDDAQWAVPDVAQTPKPGRGGRSTPRRRRPTARPDVASG